MFVNPKNAITFYPQWHKCLSAPADSQGRTKSLKTPLCKCLGIDYGMYIVVPPSLIPLESGNRGKTDKRDSRKLARLLESNMLKKVYVLTEEDHADRELVRTRRQLQEHRTDVMRQIKSKLLFYAVLRCRFTVNVSATLEVHLTLDNNFCKVLSVVTGKFILNKIYL